MNNDQKERFRRELADKFIHLLETEKMEWTQGWQSGNLTPPFNAVNGNQYKGVNRFTLTVTSMIEGYDDPRWVTMNQIQDKKETYHKGEKWHLKAGSHGTKVEYWYPYDHENHKPMTWDQYKTAIKNGRDRDEFLIYPKYFTVFNASQIEGIAPVEKEFEFKEIHVDDLINKLSESMNVPIHYDGNGSAYYRPSTDDIHLPRPEVFYSSAEFAGTALHELAHSTGHPDRLNRDIKNLFGSENYAFEELIAEMTSCFMAPDLQDVDITSFNRFENNQAYLQSWIQAIKEKPDALIRAVKEADRATFYMEYKLGMIPEPEYKKINTLEEITIHPEQKKYDPITELSQKLSEFAEKYDPYEVKDVEEYKGQIRDMAVKDLKENKIDPYKNYLNNVVQTDSRPEIKTEAFDLKNELESFEKTQAPQHPFRMHF